MSYISNPTNRWVYVGSDPVGDPMWGQTPAMVQGPWNDVKFLISDADGHCR
jgi:hypothetical protein